MHGLYNIKKGILFQMVSCVGLASKGEMNILTSCLAICEISFSNVDVGEYSVLLGCCRCVVLDVSKNSNDFMFRIRQSRKT